jgi:dihydroorotate dehydrogenase electron transfer subunit
MIQQTATILWNQPVGPACYRMGLTCPQGYAKARPGQFVMVQSGPTPTPLLRRPFSIFSKIGTPDHPEGIELLYKAVGRGTQQMARMTPGQTVDLLGPLGRGFHVPENTKKIYLAAGGLGVAPIRFLASVLMHDRGGIDCTLFLGGRSQEDLLCPDDFRAMGISVTLTTDDGTAGQQCLLTDPLAEAVQTQPPDLLCACGPHGMLQCVAGIAKRFSVPCQLSLETTMACGMGACLGCAVPKAAGEEGYHHVCVDGPVFESGRIRF